MRRHIGTKRWRSLHRLTLLVYALGIVHALGVGTDASTLWLRAILLVTGAPILFLALLRGLPGDAPAPRSAARRGAANVTT